METGVLDNPTNHICFEADASIKSILYTKEELDSAVANLGKKISNDYKGKELIVVCVLKGSVIFFSDLIRNISCDCKIDFIGASSYGCETQSSGVIRMYKDLDLDIKDKHVLIVEDILDTAKTMDYLIHMLKGKKPAGLKICTLLDKKARREVDVSADYKCFDVANEFVVGYGLDFNEEYRNLPYIGILKEEKYN